VLGNEGRWKTEIQKMGANMQGPKKKGKNAVGVQNEGSYTICPIMIVGIMQR